MTAREFWIGFAQVVGGVVGFFAFIVLVFVIAVVIHDHRAASRSASVNSSETAASVTKPDAAAVDACGDFVDLLNGADLRTDDEQRAKIAGLYNGHGLSLGAKDSESPGVASSARAMLADATAGDGPALTRDGTKLMQTCVNLGVITRS